MKANLLLIACAALACGTPGSDDAADAQVNVGLNADLRGPCAPGEVLNDNQPCGPSPDGGASCGPQLGDLKCYAQCVGDSDCGGARPLCVDYGFYAGRDFNCTRVVRLCMADRHGECAR